jgi:hypothetical protein
MIIKGNIESISWCPHQLDHCHCPSLDQFPAANSDTDDEHDNMN